MVRFVISASFSGTTFIIVRCPLEGGACFDLSVKRGGAYQRKYSSLIWGRFLYIINKKYHAELIIWRKMMVLVENVKNKKM